MLGWWILIQAADIPDVEKAVGKEYPTLAKWETGVDGMRWIDTLVKEGLAVEVWRHGYPNRFKAKAADVLPLLAKGGVKPPTNGLWVFGVDEGEEYATPPGWTGKVNLDQDAIAACSPDQVLTIDAWDQS